MIDHEPHRRNATLALAYFDAATSGFELARRAVIVTTALRCLLYEPADEYQGDFIEGRYP